MQIGALKGGIEGLLLTLLRVGKATFFIPYTLAYGEKGSSPDIPQSRSWFLPNCVY